MTPALALAQEYYPRTRPTLQHLPERQPPPLHYPQTRPSLQNPQLQLVLGERVSARKSSCSSSRQRPPELKPLGFAPLLPPNSNHLGFNTMREFTVNAAASGAHESAVLHVQILGQFLCAIRTFAIGRETREGAQGLLRCLTFGFSCPRRRRTRPGSQHFINFQSKHMTRNTI